jgi:TMEM199 family protein
VSNEEDHDPISPSLVINIFMSMLLCGFATFWALKNFQTPEFMGWGAPRSEGPHSDRAGKDPVFVLVSMFVGVLVGVAETVVYAAYLRKVRQAKDAEKRVKERKEVVSSEALSNVSTSEGHDEDDGEEVKIWGKGVNGGVRRRVRERWENEK